mgnify:CR=1 FL=1
MKKAFLFFAVALATVLALGYLYRDSLKARVYAQITQDMFIDADTDEFDPGPAIGSSFPGVRARYEGREITLIQEFAGTKGTVFIASRSLDWCPYCMRQLIQLQETSKDFSAAGIGLVAITYDEPKLQQAFIDKFGITIPVLSDVDGLSFKTLGILNDEYQQGDFQYGIPHPGMIVIDPAGRVVGKLFLEAYSTRVDSKAALAFAQKALGISRAATPRALNAIPTSTPSTP